MKSNVVKDETSIEKLVDFISAPWWTTSARQKMRIFDGSVPFYGPFLDMVANWAPTPGIPLDAEPDATGTLTDLSTFGNGQPDNMNIREFGMFRFRHETKTKIRLNIAFPNKNTGTIRLELAQGRLKDGVAVLEKLDGLTRSGWMQNVVVQDRPIVKEEWGWRSFEFKRISQASPGLYFNLFHQWSTYFRIPGSIAVRFPIDSRIALDLFADREKEPGKLRRDALLHWVKAHLRRKRTSDTDFSEVRKHIRGREKFFWRGFECVIAPDEDYMASLDRSKP